MAKNIFESLTIQSPGYLSLLVWSETFLVLTEQYKIPKPAVIDVLTDLSSRDEIASEDPQNLRLALSAAAQGKGFTDALIALTARQAGCDTVVTFNQQAPRDLGFKRLKPRRN
jgi:predicted nucleic-acid-binding protein